MGKSMNGIVDIFNLLEVDKSEQKLYLDIIKIIDRQIYIEFYFQL